ncbi:ComEC family competence protein [Novipirellula aureliae]|uniref:ComEC family competence protein n=1 Tax=Novipirellula aureliae TaxID=2527966 RepID=A0A5C6DIE0_9BACT|nr:ComEC/Rec2 family competence protein [Novipirellula aureliae]TWU36610.1 ComEC family competence protein [Novipirellula aureliae]
MTSAAKTRIDSNSDGPIHDFWARHPLLILAIAFAAGIAIDSCLPHRLAVRQAAWMVVASATIVTFFFGTNAIRRVAIAVLFFAFAGLYHAYCDARYQSASILSIATTDGEPTILEGVIMRPIVIRKNPLGDWPRHQEESPWQSIIQLNLRKIRIEDRFEPCRGHVHVVCTGYLAALRPGDELRVFGQLQQINHPTNPGELDLRKVYRHRGIHARVDVDAEEQVVLLGSRFALDRPIASIATRSRELLLKYTGDTMGPLAVALVIGQREFVDSETRDLLLVTGTAHLLSVSGLHLAIVIVLASWTATLLRFPLGIRIGFILTVCCLYTAITGGRPPVMRAAVLVAVVMTAIWLRRPAQPINTLSMAGLLLMILNPENLFHVGVQLSFVAVGTLFLCGQRVIQSSRGAEIAVENEEQLDRLIHSVAPAFVRYGRYVLIRLGRAVWYSGCVSLISMPLVWHQFHVVSFVSVATNVLLSPFLFWSLANGVLTVIGGSIFEPLAIVPGCLCGWGLATMHWVIAVAATVPAGHFWLPSPPAGMVVLFYGVMIASLSFRGRFASSFRYAWIPTWGLAAWFFAMNPSPLPEGTLQATFVDVGHGTSVVIRGSDGHVWLYDCGRLANIGGSSRDIDSVLWSTGTTRIDAVFLSHADSDHYNALPGILERFRVDRIVTPPGLLMESESGLIAVRKAIEEANVAVVELTDLSNRPFLFQTASQEHHAFKVLHPPAGGVDGSDNANSLVLQIEHYGSTLLLPGDLEPPGTQVLIDKPRPKPGGVLMAPHHGSLTMDAEAILQWSRPADVIVSGGKRAKKPEVQRMLNAYGSEVHVTANLGAICVTIDRDGKIRVASWDAPQQ